MLLQRDFYTCSASSSARLAGHKRIAHGFLTQLQMEESAYKRGPRIFQVTPRPPPEKEKTPPPPLNPNPSLHRRSVNDRPETLTPEPRSPNPIKWRATTMLLSDLAGQAGPEPSCSLGVGLRDWNWATCLGQNAPQPM